MPVYEYYCPSCSRDFERLMKVASRDSASCLFCGNEENIKRKVSKPADMSIQWNQHYYGINGKYDRSLGCVINNPDEARKIAESKGLIAESDLPKDFIRERAERICNAEKELQRQDKKLDELSKKYGGGAEGEAMASLELYPDKDLLNETGEYAKRKAALADKEKSI